MTAGGLVLCTSWLHVADEWAVPVEAIATCVLVLVGLLAARWAKETAATALKTLRLESEPSILVGLGVSEQIDDWRWVELILQGALFVNPDSPNDSTVARMTFRNIGRTTAVNLRIELTVTAGPPVTGDLSRALPTTTPVFIQDLSPGTADSPGTVYTVGFRNPSHVVVYVAVASAFMDDPSLPGKQTPARFFLSRGLPLVVI